MKLIEIKSTSGKAWKVMPRWRGQNLAVHAPVVNGVCNRTENRWVITHRESGLHTGGHFCGSLREAIKAARFWDGHFATVTEKNASRWPLAQQWKRIITSGYAERPFRSIETVQEILSR